ncbi:GNAT family N-acetyltransferase [Ruminococcus sp. HUN007]|uniref:GNAT family N-acetyltransferase n=1 Tax=Ruminococcus sp. HUN007 TaxID=1514668 RepID=UPI000AE5119C
MVLLVVDIQNGITDDRLYAFDEFKKNTGTLISEARKNNVEVIFVRHDDGPGTGFSVGDDDFEIFKEFSPKLSEKVFDKNVNSAFYRTTGLLRYLQVKHVKKVMAVGLMTDYCIDATIKSGFENDFEMIVPEKCNTTRGNEYLDGENIYKFYNEKMWPGRYAKCVTMDEAVSMIRKHGAEKEVPDKKAITGCGTQVIETERLILRKFTFDDVDSMMRNWVADDEVQNNYGEPSYKTPEAVKGLLDEYIGYYQSGYYFRWAVTEKESGECIGQVAYFLVDPNNHFGEIEYCIGTAYQGKGYATEATRAIIKYGFEKIGFNKIQICARPVNIPSKRVIEKCGFKLDGVLPEYFCINGEYQDRMYFSLLKED